MSRSVHTNFSQPNISIIWVHYRTPDLINLSLNKALDDLAESGLSHELIVVDNGGLPDDFEQQNQAQTHIIRNTENVGYAGGINIGMKVASGHAILVLNPDVMIEPGCIKALVKGLETADIVAPLVFLDHNRVFQLPANERRDFTSAALRTLAERTSWCAKIARKRWRAHVYRAMATPHCYELSGAILCFKRATWESLGPWDDSYRLYFEESEWLQRARAKNLIATFVHDAIAIHLYAQSTRHQPNSERWFATSLERFEKQHYSPYQRSLLKRLRNWVNSKQRGGAATSLKQKSSKQKPAYAELSNSVIGFPAALVDLTQHPQFDESMARCMLDHLPKANYGLRWVSKSGSELDYLILHN